MSQEGNGENPVFDCGVNTLYLLLRLKGMDADLEEIRGRLPRDAEKGSSIHDLETYLHSRGIKTDARLMRLSDLCKKRESLAVLLTQKDENGHFVVARVLPDGRLQIIDSLLGARIEQNAPTSKTSLPMILIDPKGGSEWTWKVFAGVGACLLGYLVLTGLTGFTRFGK